MTFASRVWTRYDEPVTSPPAAPSNRIFIAVNSHAARCGVPMQFRQASRRCMVCRVLTLDRVVPWGRSFDEYCRMFALEEPDLARRILGCGDGPASFNAVATRRGLTVTSCD